MLIATPLALSLCTAIVAMLLQRRVILIGLIGIAALLSFYISAIYLLHSGNAIPPLHVGAWPEPYTISLVISDLACKFGILFSVAALCPIILLAREEKSEQGYLIPLVFFLLLGVNGILLSNDLFNMYVWLEVSFLASLGIIAQSKTSYSMQYFGANFINSTAILLSIGLIYGVTGSLSLSVIPKAFATPVGIFASIILLFSLMFKVGIWPYSFWVERIYPKLPLSMLVLFIGTSTKSIVYMIFKLGFSDWILPMMIFGGITMASSSLRLLFEKSWKNIVIILMIGQSGLLIIASAILPQFLWILVLHDVISKISLALLGGRSGRIAGICFAIVGMSMIGIPPFLGFWAKWSVISGMWVSSMQYLAVLVLFAQSAIVVALSRMLGIMVFESRMPSSFISLEVLSSTLLFVFGIALPFLS